MSLQKDTPASATLKMATTSFCRPCHGMVSPERCTGSAARSWEGHDLVVKQSRGWGMQGMGTVTLTLGLRWGWRLWDHTAPAVWSGCYLACWAVRATASAEVPSAQPCSHPSALQMPLSCENGPGHVACPWGKLSLINWLRPKQVTDAFSKHVGNLPGCCSISRASLF